MNRIIFIIIVGISIMFISACNGEDSSGNEADYEETKKMVVDILQTDDGKQAIIEIISDDDIKKELAIESDIVKESINEKLVSEEGTEMWKNLFEDPSFVETFASSMEEEQQELMKKLMNNSDYQEQMLELLQNPEIDEQMLRVLKGQEFRSHLEKTIQQTLETPTFQAKIQEILLKAAEEQESGQGDSGGDPAESEGNGESSGNGGEDGGGGENGDQ